MSHNRTHSCCAPYGSAHDFRVRQTIQRGISKTLRDQGASIAQNAGFGTTCRAKVRDGDDSQSSQIPDYLPHF
jgi:hypothetical protein